MKRFDPSSPDSEKQGPAAGRGDGTWSSPKLLIDKAWSFPIDKQITVGPPLLTCRPQRWAGGRIVDKQTRNMINGRPDPAGHV